MGEKGILCKIVLLNPEGKTRKTLVSVGGNKVFTQVRDLCGSGQENLVKFIECENNPESCIKL